MPVYASDFAAAVSPDTVITVLFRLSGFSPPGITLHFITPYFAFISLSPPLMPPPPPRSVSATPLPSLSLIFRFSLLHYWFRRRHSPDSQLTPLAIDAISSPFSLKRLMLAAIAEAAAASAADYATPPAATLLIDYATFRLMLSHIG
jgi:hypothetical protein